MHLKAILKPQLLLPLKPFNVNAQFPRSWDKEDEQSNQNGLCNKFHHAKRRATSEVHTAHIKESRPPQANKDQTK